MVVRAPVCVALLVVVALAGCSGDGKGGDADGGLGAALDDLDVQATKDTGIIRGVVVDPAIVPIADVAIAIKALNLTTRSNANGGFGFDGLEPGEYFLEAAHPAYHPVQGHATVVAGEQEPTPIKLLLQPLPSEDPYIVPSQHTVFIQSSTAAAGSSLTVGVQAGPIQNSLFSFADDVGANATVAQAELHWDPSSPTASSLELDLVSFAGEDQVALTTWTGAKPLVGRVNATAGNLSADLVRGVMTADRAPTVNVFVNQQVEVYVHVFYNFMPRDDWQFGRDGEHPLPP